MNQIDFAKECSVEHAFDYHGQKVRSLVELKVELLASSDEEFKKHKSSSHNDFVEWIKHALKNPAFAEHIKNCNREQLAWEIKVDVNNHVQKRILEKTNGKDINQELSFQWKLGGEAGFGIMTTGLIFSKSMSRGGYHIFDYIEYPSLVRGGHNTYQVTVKEHETKCQIKKVHMLVCLNEATAKKHKDELAENAILLYDENEFTPEGFDEYQLVPVPWKQIASDIEVKPVMVNNIALGASMGLLDFDMNILFSVIEDTFKGKPQEIIDENKKAAQAGYDFIKESYENSPLPLPTREDTKQMIITGNEAIALGGIAAGVKFYAAYPMTPASSILHTMAKFGPEHGVVVKHAEDEISVANMTIGAGFAGVRSMCATSGGGFCLMSEAVGLAAITETPCVMVDAMRPGPATGLPTWTGQGDLRLVRGAGQGDFPRVIIAPGNIEECFYLTADAHNIAEKYQTPVIMLTDKFLAESHKSTPLFDENQFEIERGDLLSIELPAKDYKRFTFTDSGVSPRALPGTPEAIVRVNSDEHDEEGFSVEDIEPALKMMHKRTNKLKGIEHDLPKPVLHGDKNADITLVAWGSSRGPILEAMKILKKENINANFLQVISMIPLHTKEVDEVLSNAKKTMLIEGTEYAQFGGLIKEHTGKDCDHQYLRYDGRPFYAEDIVEKVKEVL